MAFPPSFASSFPAAFPPFTNDFESSSTFTTSTTSTYMPDTITSQTTPPGQETMSTFTSTSTTYYPTPTGNKDKENDGGFFDRLEGGTKAGMGIAITVGILIIVAVSVWYCCGCCGIRARRRKLREGLRAPDINPQRGVPLNTMNSGAAPPPVGDAPPQYEEAVPPRHQHIAGGARYFREDEEGVISDGKTPLSEIPFEDVVLDHSPSEGSSRSFSERHHGLGGDTRGHTNT